MILGAAISVCGVLLAEDRSRVTFSATVQEVIMLSQYSGPARVVHFDPRFALRVKMEVASPDAPEFVVGETVVFAIHSPAQLFAPAADPNGMTFTFSVLREIADGKPKFRLLQIERQAEEARRTRMGATDVSKSLPRS